jgi:hypothetical protein
MFVSVYRPGSLRRITTIGTARKVASEVKVGYPVKLLQHFRCLGREIYRMALMAGLSSPLLLAKPAADCENRPR